MKKIFFSLLSLLILGLVFSCSKSTSPVGPSMSLLGHSDLRYDIVSQQMLQSFSGQSYTGVFLDLPFIYYQINMSGETVSFVTNNYVDKIDSVTSRTCFGFYFMIRQGAAQYLRIMTTLKFTNNTLDENSVNLNEYGNAFRFWARAVVTNDKMVAGDMKIAMSGGAYILISLTKEWKQYVVPFSAFMNTVDGMGIGSYNNTFKTAKDFTISPPDAIQSVNQMHFYLIDDVEILNIVQKY